MSIELHPCEMGLPTPPGMSNRPSSLNCSASPMAAVLTASACDMALPRLFGSSAILPTALSAADSVLPMASKGFCASVSVMIGAAASRTMTAKA